MYYGHCAPKLMKQFGFSNPHQIPAVEKIVLNVGLGEAIKQPKLLDAVVEELAMITGQRPVRKKAKKSIANFGLREGQEIGAAVTLRGARMWEFLDRFIRVAIPRIRDFRGLSTRVVRRRGNYSMGVKEQMIFPEINYDMVEQIHGMDITIVTTPDKDDQALALLRELGMAFRGRQPNAPEAGRPHRANAEEVRGKEWREQLTSQTNKECGERDGEDGMDRARQAHSEVFAAAASAARCGPPARCRCPRVEVRTVPYGCFVSSR